MQWFFNLFYSILDHLFTLLGQLTAPDWLSEFAIGAATYTAVINYYFPLDTLVMLAVAVLGFAVVCIIISAIIQLL